MRISRNIQDMPEAGRQIVLAIGMLDGIHVGHQKVLNTALDHARVKESGAAWVLTFEPHPRKVLNQDSKAFLLTSLAHKLRLLESCNIDGCILEPFTPELQDMTPRAFLEYLLEHIPGLEEIVVGKNWTFGSGAAGDVDTLCRLGEEFDVEITVIEPVLVDGRPVSSTRIRQAVVEGRLAEVRRMLGRPFSVLGTVVEGEKIGRELGYPTANIDAATEVEPPPGIYAIYAIINGIRHDGVAYYGSRPTFADATHKLILEVHLFDGHFELYSREMEVFFLQYLRPDRNFGSKAELIEAIGSDCERAREILRSE